MASNYLYTLTIQNLCSILVSGRLSQTLSFLKNSKWFCINRAVILNRQIHSISFSVQASEFVCRLAKTCAQHTLLNAVRRKQVPCGTAAQQPVAIRAPAQPPALSIFFLLKADR